MRQAVVLQRYFSGLPHGIVESHHFEGTAGGADAPPAGVKLRLGPLPRRLNLLNRLLDKTLPRTAGITSLLASAVAALPHLIDHLETGRMPGGSAKCPNANKILGQRLQRPAFSN